MADGGWSDLWHERDIQRMCSIFSADPGPRDPGWTLVVYPKLSDEQFDALSALPLHDTAYSYECENFSPFKTLDAIRKIVPEAKVVDLTVQS